MDNYDIFSPLQIQLAESLFRIEVGVTLLFMIVGTLVCAWLLEHIWK